MRALFFCPRNPFVEVVFNMRNSKAEKMHGFMYIPSKRRAVKIDCKMNLVFVGYIRDSLNFRINWVIAIIAIMIMIIVIALDAVGSIITIIA